MVSPRSGPLAPSAGSTTAVPCVPGRGATEAWAPLIRKTGWDSGAGLAAASGPGVAALATAAAGTAVLGPPALGAAVLGTPAVGAAVLGAAAAAGASTPATATAVHAALASLLIFTRMLPALGAQVSLAQRLAMITRRSGGLRDGGLPTGRLRSRAGAPGQTPESGRGSVGVGDGLGDRAAGRVGGAGPQRHLDARRGGERRRVPAAVAGDRGAVPGLAAVERHRHRRPGHL